MLTSTRLRLFNSFLLYDIKQIRIDLGNYRGHFGTLTPFHHACMAQRVDKPMPEPQTLPAPELLRDDGLGSLQFTSMPIKADGTVLSLDEISDACDSNIKNSLDLLNSGNCLTVRDKLFIEGYILGDSPT